MYGAILAARPGGRSPHTRGRLNALPVTIRNQRSIPAYAGEALCQAIVGSYAGVDPRIRGGGSREMNAYTAHVGRSPHTRGRLTQNNLLRSRQRSIPAYAGEAQGRRKIGMVSAVDPRIRGGGDPTIKPRVLMTGRSPHTRGRQHYCLLSPINKGSIPAYAGEA